MRIICLVVTAMFFSLSCRDTDIDNIGEIGTFVVSIDDALRYVPIHDYRENKNVYFKNAEGDTLSLSIVVTEEQKKKSFDGREYETEETTIHLTSSRIGPADLSIIVSANYSALNEPPLQFLWAILSSAINNGYAPSARLDSHGNPLISNFAESLLLNQRQFQNVYYSFSPPAHIISYSEIYYNSSFGIVGFRDQKNELWTFDRWE
jgi:hypothetical protein